MNASTEGMSGYVARVAAGTDPSRREILQVRQENAFLRVADGRVLPPPELMHIIGSPDRGHFLDSMREFLWELTVRMRLEPGSSVLDIGCGAGRLSLPLSYYLDESGSLYGVDVWEAGIQWCSDNITGTVGTRDFRTLRVENNYYFEEAKAGVVNSIDLGHIADSSIDLAFAISVFSHMRAVDIEEYFKELRRILKPSGHVYITGFVMDRYFNQYRSKTGLFSEVEEVAPGEFEAYAGQDIFAGFSMRVWMSMVEKFGFYLLSLETGQWADKPGSRQYQDLLLLGVT